MEHLVLIRGYGDIGYPTICTYCVKAKESQAITIIEEYLKVQTVTKPERYHFEIRTEDDTRHLYCYRNHTIYQDEREISLDTRKRVIIRAFNGDTQKCIYEHTDYEDEATLHMDIFLEIHSKQLQTTNLYFRVYALEDSRLLYTYFNSNVMK